MEWERGNKSEEEISGEWEGVGEREILPSELVLRR